MTFKHRLARRLAQSRTIAGMIAVVLVGACSGATETAAPTGDPLDNPSDPTTISTLTSTGPGNPGVITSRQNTSQCIDVYGESTKAGTTLISYTCQPAGANLNELFTYYPASQELKVYNATTCVDATGELGRDGDPILIWSCNGGTNQKWTFT